jgi:hypothetical protein
VSISKYLPIAIASASLGALVVIAMTPRNAQAQQAQAPVAQVAPVQQAAAPAAPAQGEQKLDTSAAPIITTHALTPSKIRTTPEDQLPTWVPKKGRLSVVDSTDLAENLGLVPEGTTKANPNERISVKEKLNERAKDTNNYATGFTYSKAGKFRSKL